MMKIYLIAFLLVFNCSHTKKNDDANLAPISMTEFEDKVNITEVTQPVVLQTENPDKKTTPVTLKTTKKKEKGQKNEGKIIPSVNPEPIKPDYGPVLPGEKTVFAVKYMGMQAGFMSLEVLPQILVNKIPHYHFLGKIWTTDSFSKFYRVQDEISSMVDLKSRLPSVYKLKVNETKKQKEARFYINHLEKKAYYWEKSREDGEPEVEKKQEWLVEPNSQDVFSSLFYLRFLSWSIGQENFFNVAADEENQIYRGRALRYETLDTAVGQFQTIVIQPKVELKGKFKQNGDILVWLTRDQRQRIVKFQAKLAFGSLTAELIELR